jgi:P27 family predicted phage terminase small subunit
VASPKPRPPSLKLINGRGEGKDSGGRPVKPAPGFVRLPPEPPEWLPVEAAAEWRRVVPEMQRLQLLKPVDRAALTAYVLAWDRLVTAQRELSRNLDDRGRVSVLGVNSQGVCRHPAVAVVEAASKDLRAWCGEFGFTPSAEGRLNTPGGDGGEDNPYA